MTSTVGSGVTAVTERFLRWSAITLTLVIDVVVALAPSDKFPNRVKHIPMRMLKSGDTAGVLECGEGVR